MKLLFALPHCSTGGMPQYVVKLVESLISMYEIYVVEYHDISPDYVVQKNALRKLLGENLISLYGTDEEKDKRFFELLAQIQPDIVHLQEIPEMWMTAFAADTLYSNKRTYKIVETSHDSGFNPSNKRYFPDSFAFISQFHPQQYKAVLEAHHIPWGIVEYPIELKERPSRTEALQALNLDPKDFHILNVGLFTPRKNQAEIMEIARHFTDRRVVFHFVGNQAGNFQSYWEPLMKNIPKNCKIWGERGDVDNFYKAMDLFLFTSLGHNTDRETNPIVLKEALSWQMPIIMYNLPVYCGMYDIAPNVRFTTSKEKTIEMLKSQFFAVKEEAFPVSFLHVSKKVFNVSFESEVNKIHFQYIGATVPRTFRITCKELHSKACMYSTEWTISDLSTWLWIIPMGVSIVNFATDLGVKGLLLEYYEGGELIDTDEIFIKEVDENLPICDLTNTEPIFQNYHEFFVEHIYDYLPIDGLDTVFDIGANVGLWTTYILRRGVEFVYCFEPNHTALRDLRNNMIPDATIVVDKAVSYENGQLELHSGANSLLSSFYTPGDGNPRPNSYTVDTITIDTAIKEFGLSKVDLVKMDIEGAEFEIIEHLTKEVYDKIKYFIVELHPFYVPNGEEQCAKLVKTLQTNGYEVEYSKNLNYVFAKKKEQAIAVSKKIKLVHLQTDKNDLREITSKASLISLYKYGIEYKRHHNAIYESTPPVHNCMRPECIGTKSSDYTTPMGVTALTPAHYGCFESFKIAMLREFDKDLDFLILCEGDCLIEVDKEKFIEMVEVIGEIMEREDIGYFSFGDTATLDGHVRQSEVVYVPENQNLCFVTDKIIGLQCIMFSKKYRDILQDAFMYDRWDAADIFLNVICSRYHIKMGILNNRITTQANGVSLIDGMYKKFSL